MKKTLSVGLLCINLMIFGQVGIGTPNPRGALDINKGTTNDMGLVLPTNENVNNIITPQGGSIIAGTIIYDSTNDCIRHYKTANSWSGCLSTASFDGNGSINILNCTAAVYTGTLVVGSGASGVSSTIPYTGGNGGSHNGQTAASTGVTGLTATLTAGSFASGNGNLTYAITGIPLNSGTANFAINIGGKTCVLAVPVTPAFPCSAAGRFADPNDPRSYFQCLQAGGIWYQYHYTCPSGTIWNQPTQLCTAAPIGSIGGLNCSSASYKGTLVVGNTASNVSAAIPYTGGNGGSHSGQTVASTGVTGLTATLTAGSFAGSGDLVYTIIGNPTSSGTANFALNIGGKTCTLSVNVATAFPCSTAGRFADPNDPRSYFQCLQAGGIWYQYHYTCPAGNHWDQSKQLCTPD
ncbi:hypothetical protein M2347_003854 [Chryseobacterium sp. H1D6B]|uniref:carbohydrate-binding module family 14 protein n=1 Tax=Chryseobacterium sp. H1D6B TaxID=2940588 RepID=UPI0015CC27AD|nr:carbohydrate-binding module family 14 protein [Chryseobacterium sp. H1D6B]MDH6254127.1 hypothetical protein [Chryseobacterium sp. H1D6B]